MTRDAIRAVVAEAPTQATSSVAAFLPAFAGISVFRRDVNVRDWPCSVSSRRGIGLQLEASLNTLAGPAVSAILATVVVGEWRSARLRHAIR